MNGIILIDKEKNYTSHDVVACAKKMAKTKVGHTGTLDPNATGVLPLLIGDATKVSKYLINHDKEYDVELQLGKKTTTADIEGEIIEEKEVPQWIFSNIKKLEDGLQDFVGKQTQIPPIYSAIKVNGKKLYEYARKNQEVKIKPRNIEIYSIKLIRTNKNENTIKFKVSCSKGTYIRSLCEDIAKKLETVGFMKNLRRTRVGQFKIENAKTLDNINFEKDLISIEELFKNEPKIEINKSKEKAFLNGVKISQNVKDGVVRIYMENKFIGLGIAENNKVKRDIIINI